MAKKPSSKRPGVPPPPIEPSSADEFFARGWSHYSRKEFFRAESDFRKAIELAPGHPDGLYGLAQALQASGRPQEAIAAFENLLQTIVDPTEEDRVRYHMLAKLARGHINYIKSGDWKLTS